VFDSQKLFRLILDALANPTSVVNIKEQADKISGSYPVFLAVAMTLLDNEVSFEVSGERSTPSAHKSYSRSVAPKNGASGDTSMSEQISSLTLARREGLEAADFVFVRHRDALKHVIENVKCGTLSDPHKSATVIIHVDDDPTCTLKLSGPGIDGHVVFLATQTMAEAIQLRDAQNYEYPQGIDLLFASSNGDLCAIPRLIREVG